MRKTLEVCKPSQKIISRKNKVNLLFDFNILEVNVLEEKYNMSFDQLEKVYKDFFKDIYKPHQVEFKKYLQLCKGINMMKEDLLEKI